MTHDGLINPQVIVFGENAKLDIGGSFVGTTANSIKFADGRVQHKHRHSKRLPFRLILGIVIHREKLS